MADDLDDFFAKKDKKKKTKSKFTPAELLQQQAVGDAAAAEKKKKKKSKSKEASDKSSNAESNNAAFSIERDEDWIAYEGEKEVDYSGLRIATLQISKETEDDNEPEEEYEEDEDGNMMERRVKEETGPWKTITPAPPVNRPPTPPSDEEPEPAAPAVEEAPAQPKKYVPPSVRRAAAAAAAAPAPAPRSHRFRKKEAPDVQNVLEFPSLGTTTAAGDRQLERELERQNPGVKFETVRVGNRDLDQSSGSHKIELGNRFASLQN